MRVSITVVKFNLSNFLHILMMVYLESKRVHVGGIILLQCQLCRADGNWLFCLNNMNIDNNE